MTALIGPGPCRRAHIVSHDMGDSVLTEILARHQRAALPGHFDTFFQSITFTNGGMVYDLINKRLGQVTQTTSPIYTLFIQYLSRSS